MDSKESIIEEIKANFCVARDGLIEAAKIMDDSGCFLESKKETHECIGDLCVAISVLDSELLKMRGK